MTAPGAATAAGSAGPSVLDTVLDRIAGQGPRARPVWLPPLGVPPTLGSLLGIRRGAGASEELVVPIGVVDRPFEQRHTPLVVDLRGAAGNVAVVGAPRSGKSTALATLVTALAAVHHPARVQLYCLDFGGGALASLACLPHVGSVAGRNEPDLVRRTVGEMESIVADRETRLPDRGDRAADVFLVIDGWAGLCQGFDTLEPSITALAQRGLSVGVHVVLSASRWAEIRPALRDQIGTRIELRLGDPADSELDRRQAAQVPPDQPGRGLTGGGLHMLIALPRLDDAGPAVDLAQAAADCGELLRRRHGAAAAPRVRLLPHLIDRSTLLQRIGSTGRLPILGLEECRLDIVTLDFGRQPHLLILGDSECGKTSVLHALCAEITRTCTADQAELILVDCRRGLLGLADGLADLGQLGGYAVSADTTAALVPNLLDRLAARMPGPDISRQQLRDGSWWSGPQIYLLVDDYDLVAGAAGNPLTPLLEYLPYADDLGLHLIVARRSAGAARAIYEPLLAALRDLGCMGLMMSGNPDEGPLIGSARPQQLPSGRGVLVTRRREQVVQVAWSPPP